MYSDQSDLGHMRICTLHLVGLHDWSIPVIRFLNYVAMSSKIAVVCKSDQKELVSNKLSLVQQQYVVILSLLIRLQQSVPH